MFDEREIRGLRLEDHFVGDGEGRKMKLRLRLRLTMRR